MATKAKILKKRPLQTIIFTNLPRKLRTKHVLLARSTTRKTIAAMVGNLNNSEDIDYVNAMSNDVYLRGTMLSNSKTKTGTGTCTEER